jgi:hypothetical protein
VSLCGDIACGRDALLIDEVRQTFGSQGARCGRDLEAQMRSLAGFRNCRCAPTLGRAVRAVPHSRANCPIAGPSPGLVAKRAVGCRLDNENRTLGGAPSSGHWLAACAAGTGHSPVARCDVIRLAVVMINSEVISAGSVDFQKLTRRRLSAAPRLARKRS